MVMVMDDDNTNDRPGEAIEFLRLMFAAEDWIEIRLLPSGQSRWFRLCDPAATSAAIEWAMSRNANATKPDNVYFGANPRRGDGAKGNEAIPIARSVFADFDGGATVEQVRKTITSAGLPEPTITVASGGGVHTYWLLEEPTADLAGWTARMKSIAKELGSDKSIHNPERIMRLPGSDNVKPDRPGRPRCRAVSMEDIRHDIATFPMAIAKSTPRRPSTRATGEPQQAIRLCDVAERFLRTGQVDGERRPAIFSIACDMQARGYALEDAIHEIMSRVPGIRPPLSDEDAKDIPRQIRNAFNRDREPGYEYAAWASQPAVASDGRGDDVDVRATDLTRPATCEDKGLGIRLARQVRNRLVYVRERKEWMAFDGGKWMAGADHIVVQECKRMHDELWRELAALDEEGRRSSLRFVQSTGTKKRMEAAIWGARAEPGINVSQSEFNTHPWLLNVRNGVIDLRNGELLPHDATLRITQMANVTYDPDARSELWERFIREVTCGDDEIANFLQQAFGLALTGDVSDEVLVCHNGGGCNGKSTALEAIGKMLGDYACVAPPGLFAARNFDSHPTEIAALHGKRFVTAIEQEANRALREALVKSLTGGDTIRTRRMREDFWEMKPTWHIHIAYNRAPRLTGTDDGIRRRLRVVPWAASFKDRPDLTVKERLMGEAERPGILAWCLDGLRRRLTAGRLESPPAVMVATDEYIDDEDLVGRFIQDRCEEGPRLEAEIRHTLAAFREWMIEDGTPRHVMDGYTANTLGRELARRGFVKRRPDSGVNRKRTIYVGLAVGQYTAQQAAGEDWADPFSVP